MASIELVNLTKPYRQGSATITALDGVDLRIGSGEFPPSWDARGAARRPCSTWWGF